MRVLVVEDEPDLVEALTVGLRREGYAVDAALDGSSAIDRISYTPYDAVLLDLNLPDIDGLEVCRVIRQAPETKSTRVIMLTSRDSIEDRVTGLDEGADDYLAKPFALPELLARLRALLRRNSVAASAVVEVGDLRLDAARHEATLHDSTIDLTSKEFALLRYFMLHPGEVLATERLLDHVWDEHADPFTRTVRVTISNLRRKLRLAGSEDLIETVVGAGYRLRQPS